MVELIQDFSQDQPNSSNAFDHVIIESSDRATLTMTSLPPKVPKKLRDIPDVVSVYYICLRVEKSIQVAVDKEEDVGNNLIY